MGLFSRRDPSTTVDKQTREYVLVASPLVSRDDRVVLVDAIIRFTAQPPAADRFPDVDPALLGNWHPKDEWAVHALVLSTLRQAAEHDDTETLTTSRGPLAAALDRALTLAPVATGFAVETTSVEVRAYSQDEMLDRHEFRLVSS